MSRKEAFIEELRSCPTVVEHLLRTTKVEYITSAPVTPGVVRRVGKLSAANTVVLAASVTDLDDQLCLASDKRRTVRRALATNPALLPEAASALLRHSRADGDIATIVDHLTTIAPLAEVLAAFDDLNRRTAESFGVGSLVEAISQSTDADALRTALASYEPMVAGAALARFVRPELGLSFAAAFALVAPSVRASALSRALTLATAVTHEMLDALVAVTSGPHPEKELWLMMPNSPRHADDAVTFDEGTIARLLEVYGADSSDRTLRMSAGWMLAGSMTPHDAECLAAALASKPDVLRTFQPQYFRLAFSKLLPVVSRPTIDAFMEALATSDPQRQTVTSSLYATSGLRVEPGALLQFAPPHLRGRLLAAVRYTELLRWVSDIAAAERAELLGLDDDESADESDGRETWVYDLPSVAEWREVLELSESPRQATVLIERVLFPGSHASAFITANSIPFEQTVPQVAKDLVEASGPAFFKVGNNRDAVSFLASRLVSVCGDDVDRWEFAFAQMEDFAGSVGDLCLLIDAMFGPLPSAPDSTPAHCDDAVAMTLF